MEKLWTGWSGFGRQLRVVVIEPRWELVVHVQVVGEDIVILGVALRPLAAPPAFARTEALSETLRV